MTAERTYGGIVWTNHALERLTERGISQGDAWYTWKKPDKTRYASSKGAWIYYKNFEDKKIEVVAVKNEEGKWVVISVWDRPLRTVKRPIPFGRKLNFWGFLTGLLLKKRK